MASGRVLLALAAMVALSGAVRVGDMHMSQRQRKPGLGAIITKATSFVRDVANNVKADVSGALFDTLSKISCPANTGLVATKVTQCLEADKLASGNARVSDPNFWAQAARAADLARLSYTPFDKLKSAQDRNPRIGQYQYVAFMSAADSADAMIVVRNKAVQVPTIQSAASSCNAQTGPAKNTCLTNVFAARAALWNQYYAGDFQKWDSKSGKPPAQVEVVVRGSQQTVDWIMNFRAWKVDASAPDPSEQVHSGFNAQFRALLPQVLANLTAFKAFIVAGQTELLFYGHSLGGAVSQLLADEIVRSWNLPPKKVRVFTFGSPRVGNAKWATRAATLVNHYRFKFTVDLVPEVPPNSFGYIHSDTIHYGLNQLPWSSPSRQAQQLSAYQVVCPGECSRSRADVPLIEMCHSSDLAYGTAVSAVFHWMRDFYPNSYQSYFAYGNGPRSNENQLKELEQFYQVNDNGAQSLQVLQCFGDAVCEVLRLYEGVTVTQISQCLAKWKAPTALPTGPMWANERPSQEPWITVFNVRNQLTNSASASDAAARASVLKTCLTPLMKPGFYSSFTMDDWNAALGDAVAIFNTRRQKTGQNIAVIDGYGSTTSAVNALLG